MLKFSELMKRNKEPVVKDFDPRLDRYVKLTIEIGKMVKVYENSLKIEFNVTKVGEGIGGKATIKITGLNIDDMDSLAKTFSYKNKNHARYNSVTLDVGMTNNHGVIYAGNIITVSTDVTKPDYMISLECTTAMAARYLPKPTSLKQTNTKEVAQKVADSFGVGLDYQAKNSYEMGNYIYDGVAYDELNYLRKKYPLECFIDDGMLIVIDEGKERHKGTSQVPLIDAESGLIGTPSLTLQGLKMTSILRPDVKVLGRIKVVSNKMPSINGIYSLRQITYVGSNRGKDWKMDMEVYIAGGGS